MSQVQGDFSEIQTVAGQLGRLATDAESLASRITTQASALSSAWPDQKGAATSESIGDLAPAASQIAESLSALANHCRAKADQLEAVHQ